MLEEILQTMGSKHPLHNKPICIADDEKYGDGYTKYDCLTKSGWKAYDKLIDIVYKLNQMGVLDDNTSENVIEELDKIVSQPQY